ncbi:hypothetical protein M422DRAFT_256593 [Sphaerobolus stellatus SS14]|uniref:Uncharacterized protein n=1 Tax=Sphaerobolus stellatus (strain SS14) TaxID=990650 RepID=A0A0C9VRK3_SPHS4|nr:hypothetical protein M422DRAFT_256593 [Sphaerobolus stellatus SS14]
MNTHKIKLVEYLAKLEYEKQARGFSHLAQSCAQGILGALFNGLPAASTNQQGSSTGGWEVEDTPQIDWEGQGMDYDADMGHSQDEQQLDEIEAQLKEYMLDDGAFEMDSDAEDVERDEESESDGDEE